MLNLKTGKTVWADGSFAPPLARHDRREAGRRAGAAGDAEGRPARRAERDIRWSMPAVSDDGKYVVASARSADNKDRWHVTLDPESGKTTVIDLLHDDAWVREAGGGGFGGVGRRVPARQQADLVPLRARRLDAPLHARRVGRGREAACS